MTISINDLKRTLHYEPETGIFKWLVSPATNIKVGTQAGTLVGDGYVVIRVFGKAYKAHRLAWLYMTGEWPEHTVDHRDLCRSNNRWENLRSATYSQNRANTPSENQTGFRGVQKNKSGYWAKIKIKGKTILLGKHDTAEDAHRAYMKAANEYFGDFARNS